MIVKKGIEIKLYPNKSQKVFFAKTFGCCRFVYNQCLRIKSYIYEETSGVFNCQWPTNEIYAWLKSEFGLPASRENFYKACSNFSNYTNRK